MELKNISASLRSIRLVPPASPHFAVSLGRFPSDQVVVVVVVVTTKGGSRRLEKSQSLDDDDDRCQFDMGKST